MIELVPASKEETLHLFDIVAPAEWREHGYLRRAIAEGLCHPLTISINGTPCWLIGFHETDDGGLWVDLAHTLPTANAPAQSLFDAIDQLALARGRKYVRCAVKRRGFIHLGLARGYQPEGVLLCKNL